MFLSCFGAEKLVCKVCTVMIGNQMFATSFCIIHFVIFTMVTSCEAPKCTDCVNKPPGKSFHQFPLNKPELLHKWVRAIPRDDWTPNKYSYLCSYHFHPSCYLDTPGRVGCFLRPNSIPTIFPKLEDYYQLDYKRRKSPTKRQCPLPKKLPEVVLQDPDYPQIEIQSLTMQVKLLKTQVKSLKQKVRRRNKKVKTLKSLMDNLKEKQFVSNQEFDLISHNFDGVSKYLFADKAKNQKFDSKKSNRYSQETKQFAMTLHYYSPKAYDFARKVLLLPHPSSIRSWAASVDCEPGFLCDVITSIGVMAQKKTFLSDVVLIVDAMAIYKGTWWDPKQGCYAGQVDYGTAMPEASDDLATEALVFLISGIKGHWKHPIAYFLHNKISAGVQTQLIRDCIGLLHGAGL